MYSQSHSQGLQCRLVVLASIVLLLVADTPTSSATDSRIVGGRPALEGEIPYQVSIRRSFNDRHFCGGSLITERHVLTAAHCMFYQWGGILPPIIISVVAGQLNITITRDTEFRNASKITVHPDFNSTAMTNDVAIIELEKSFPINQFIGTISPAQYASTTADCIVSGWGVQAFDSEIISESLLATRVTRISNERCDEMYGLGTIGESMICAHDNEGKHDACQGDSGGPLVCEGELLGVISTGEGCANKDYPGIYANVPYLYHWIEQNLDLKKPNTTEETTSSELQESSSSSQPSTNEDNTTAQTTSTMKVTNATETTPNNKTSHTTEHVHIDKKTLDNTSDKDGGHGRSHKFESSLGLILGMFMTLLMVCRIG